MRKYFELSSVAGVIDCVLSWRSKGISNEIIKPPTTFNCGLNPKLSYCGTKIRIQFNKKLFKTTKFYVYS